jgi:uncharacterized membrane protein YgdD (TMEM256/DUF423 family)
VLTDQSAWGAVTPVGGLLLAFGWALIALSLVLAETAHSKRV